MAHLVHPEDMSPQSMSAQEVSEALPPHGFGVPDLYPDRVYDDSHDEGSLTKFSPYLIKETEFVVGSL